MPAASILLWFLSPIGRYVGLGAIVAAVLGWAFIKGAAFDHKQYTQHLQVERQHAVTKSSVARSRAVKRFDAGRLRDDGFARD